MSSPGLTGRPSNPSGAAAYWVPAFAGTTDNRLIPSERSPLSPCKLRHDLHVGGITELIDRRYLAEAVAAVDQDFGIACEGGGVARHRHDDRDAALGEFAHLRLRALARRIEHHRVEAIEFLGDERTAEQVAPLRHDRLLGARGGGGAGASGGGNSSPRAPTIGLRPPVAAPARRSASMAPASLSAAMTRARSASRSAN